MKSSTPREMAMQNGHPYYTTGLPCKNGHVAARYTLSSVCVQCHRERSKKNADKVRNAAYNAGMGFRTPTTPVHPDDLETAESFLKALLFDRGIIR